MYGENGPEWEAAMLERLHHRIENNEPMEQCDKDFLKYMKDKTAGRNKAEIGELERWYSLPAKEGADRAKFVKEHAEKLVILSVLKEKKEITTAEKKFMESIESVQLDEATRETVKEKAKRLAKKLDKKGKK